MRYRLSLASSVVKVPHRCGCQWECCRVLTAGSVDSQEDVESAVCCVSDLVAFRCEVVIVIMKRIRTPEVNKYQFRCCHSS